MSVHKDIAKLREERDAKSQEADRLEALLAEFPDLQKKVGRWEKVAFYSKAANERANRFDIRHNCGCCNDSPLEVWPYLETPHGNVYTDPPMFQVGERHWISGDTPYPGWKDKLREARIPEDIIGAVSMHFKKCAQERKDLCEADDYDED
jgi:hypothetical protein